MPLSYEGNLTLGQCVPAALAATAQISASVGVAMPTAQAQVTGLLAISIQPPPSIPDIISSLTALLASVQSMLTAPPPIPDVTATAAALAEVQATLAQLTASIAFSTDLGQQLATPGVHYYLYAGRADALGSELGAALSAGLPGGAPGEQIAGAILLASDGGAIAALQAVLLP